MKGDLRATTVEITGHGGDAIEAYLAVPLDAATGGGVVVIHHMPGYDEGTKEITRTFAARGYAAICPNLYHREAPGAAPDDAAATARAQGGVPDERLVGDVTGAATALRALETSNGKVGTIGYCSGGRQSLLAGCSTDVQARGRLLRGLRAEQPAGRVRHGRDLAPGSAGPSRVPAPRTVRQRGPVPRARRGGRARAGS